MFGLLGIRVWIVAAVLALLTGMYLTWKIVDAGARRQAAIAQVLAERAKLIQTRRETRFRFIRDRWQARKETFAALGHAYPQSWEQAEADELAKAENEIDPSDEAACDVSLPLFPSPAYSEEEIMQFIGYVIVAAAVLGALAIFLIPKLWPNTPAATKAKIVEVELANVATMAACDSVSLNLKAVGLWLNTADDKAHIQALLASNATIRASVGNTPTPPAETPSV